MLGDLIAIVFCSLLFGIFIFLWLILFCKTLKRDNEREFKREQFYSKEEEKIKNIINSIPKNEFYNWKLKMFEVQELFDNLNLANNEKTKIKNQIASLYTTSKKYKTNSTYSSLIKNEEKVQKQIGRIRENIDLKLKDLNLSTREFLNIIDELARKNYG